MCRLHSEKQVWQIHQPFKLTEEDERFLIANPLNEKRGWHDKIYKPLKDRIREYYFDIQNHTCAYCRLPINGGTDNIEIEHIVDKSHRIDFTFEPLNLVVSCHKCNFAKTTKRVLHNCPPINDYPSESEEFKIIHGHLDDYFENIEFLKGSIYHAIEEKGEFTIKTCNLDRFMLAEQREKVEMYEDDPIIAKVLEIRKIGNNDPLLDEILQLLNQCAGDTSQNNNQ